MSAQEERAQAALAAAKAAVANVLEQTGQILTISIVLLVFVVVSTALRMYVRLGMLHRFDASDWSMVVTFLLSASQCCSAIAVVMLGREAVVGRPRSVGLTSGLSKWSTGTFALALVALKISLGFFFLHIFSHKRVQRYFIITLVILSTITGIAYFVFLCFTCTTLLKPPGRDLGCPIQPYGEGVFYTFSVIAFTSDYLFTLMGMFALWKAKLPVHTKVLACFLLVIAAAGGIASTIRFALLVRPITPQNFRQSTYDVGKWTIVEHAVGVIAANLAMTRPLVSAFFKKVRGHATTLSGNKSGGTHGMTGGRAGTGPGSGYMRGQEASGDVRTVENNGEAYLLHEIKKEVAVNVDEEKADQKEGSQGSRELDFERDYVYGRPRRM
ncbi:hypothetical protein CAC42_1586 [Sphaceloma murrayae]|uniref:Rhodopsin domain-containing protein n=1 Tax=Sphaceloma murrayae TaxID=2082308 RepID=A0A2K1R359_9PEZI|nr:hypothetical protein CAC42_1586 [Sphaceloma murrayae]